MRPTKKKKKTRRGRKKIYDDTRPGEDFYDNYLLGRLSGAWTAFSPAGDSEGTVHFRDLAWYGLENDPAMTSPFLRFVHMSPRGSIVFEYADGEEACARIDGDTLTWGDGYVYYRIERQTDDENGGGTLTRGALPEGPPPWAHSNPEDDVRRVIGEVAGTETARPLRSRRSSPSRMRRRRPTLPSSIRGAVRTSRLLAVTALPTMTMITGMGLASWMRTWSTGLETAAAPLTGTSPLQWHAHCMTGTLLISVRALQLILTVLLGCVTIMNM